MVTRTAIALVALFSVAPPSSPGLFAHEGHDHKILGTVTMAAPDHLMLEDREGKKVTVRVTNDTKVKPPMKVEDIDAGTRVVVTATQQKDKSFRAKTIEIGAAPAAPK
jgi:hypothetical protein